MAKKDYPRRSLSTDSYATDKWLKTIFSTWFDPCPLNEHWEKIAGGNGLELEWKDRTFVKPPNSNPKPWSQKAISEAERGKNIAMLLKHDSSTEWYRILHEYNGSHFLLINERLKHETGTSCAFPSVLVIIEGAKQSEQQRLPI